MSRRVSKVAGYATTSATAYVAVLLAAVLVEWVSGLVHLAQRLRTGILVTDVVGLLLLAVAFALWTRYRPAASWSTAGNVFFASLIALWVAVSVTFVLHDQQPEWATLLVPGMLLLLWGKRPDADSVYPAADAFALVIAAVCVVWLVRTVLTSGGGTPVTGLTPNEVGLLDFERTHYWLPLNFLPGLDRRWYGPFEHPNLTGAIGAFLLVYGASRPRLRRLALVATGGLVLLATASRTSMLAAAVGVGVLVVALVRRRQNRRRAVLLVGLVGVAVLALFVATGVRDPTLNGRLLVWPEYVALWRQQPWTGVGRPGIEAAAADGALPAWAWHANAAFVDILARNGVIAFVLLAAAFACAVVVAWRSARAAAPLGLALVAMVMVSWFTDDHVDWRYAGPAYAVLVLAVLLSAGPEYFGRYRSPESS